MSASERDFDKRLESVIATIVAVIALLVLAAWMLDAREDAKYVEKDITRTVTLAPGDAFIGIAEDVTYTGINNQTATFSIHYQDEGIREPRNITYASGKTFTLAVVNDDSGKRIPVKFRFVKRDGDDVTFEQTTQEDVDKKTGKLRYPLEGIDAK